MQTAKYTFAHLQPEPRIKLPHCPVVDSFCCPECGSINVNRGDAYLSRFERICHDCFCYWEIPHQTNLQAAMQGKGKTGFGFKTCEWPGCETYFEKPSNNCRYCKPHRKNAKRRMSMQWAREHGLKSELILRGKRK